MRLVLDTSVLVAAFRSRNGASRRLIELALERRIQLVASVALFLEYEAVLLRPEHAVVHGLGPHEVEEALVGLAGFTVPVTIHFSYRPKLRDAEDEMVLEAAVNGNAVAIVTHNVRDFLPATHEFGIEVWTPGSIMKKGLI